VVVGDTFRRIIEKVALALPPTRELFHSLLPNHTGLAGNAMCNVPRPPSELVIVVSLVGIHVSKGTRCFACVPTASIMLSDSLY
jgi:hypothetical protein